MTHLVGARGADDLGCKVRLLLDGRVRLEREELLAAGLVRRRVEVAVDLVSELCALVVLIDIVWGAAHCRTWCVCWPMDTGSISPVVVVQVRGSWCEPIRSAHGLPLCVRCSQLHSSAQ